MVNVYPYLKNEFMPFHFNNDLYRFSLAPARYLLELKLEAPDIIEFYSTFGDIMSQMHRAAISIPLNIAEAYGKVGAGHRLQHFGHARGSLYELVACFDIIPTFPMSEEQLLNLDNLNMGLKEEISIAQDEQLNEYAKRTKSSKVRRLEDRVIANAQIDNIMKDLHQRNDEK